MFVENQLKLPCAVYKISGLLDGTTVCRALEQVHLRAVFNGRTVEILESSKISKELIHQALYAVEFASRYEKLFPRIQRNSLDENWEIAFDHIRPKIPPYIPPKNYLSQAFGTELPDSVPQAKKFLFEKFCIPKLAFTEEDLLDIQQKISFYMIDSITAVKGFWYKAEFSSCYPDMLTEEELEGGYLNPLYFNKVGHYKFVLKEGQKAADAIKSLFNGITVVDCGTAITICFYNTLLQIVGEEKFNAYFSEHMSHVVMKITISPLTFGTLIDDFCRFSKDAYHETEGSINHRPLKIGDMCSFHGVHFYGNKHCAGSAGNWNVIYVGDNPLKKQLFMGHGFLKPMTEEEIYALELEEYNKERTKEDFARISKMPETQLKLVDAKSNPFLKKFYKITSEDIAAHSLDAFLEGYQHFLTRRLDPKLVLALLNIEIEKIKDLQCDLYIRRKFRFFSVSNGFNTCYS